MLLQSVLLTTTIKVFLIKLEKYIWILVENLNLKKLKQKFEMLLWQLSERLKYKHKHFYD